MWVQGRVVKNPPSASSIPSHEFVEDGGKALRYACGPLRTSRSSPAGERPGKGTFQAKRRVLPSLPNAFESWLPRW